MKALLKKDYLTSKFSFLILTLLAALAVIVLSMITTEGSIIIGSLSCVFIPLIVNKLSATEEMRKHYNIVMNSFPVKRRDVVISKFIFYLLLYFFTTAIFLTITIVFNKLSGFDLNMFLFINSLVFIYYILFVGVPNCIYYCTNYEVYMKYTTIITLVIVNVPILVGALLDKVFPGAKEGIMNLIRNSSMNKGILLIVIAGMVLYITLMIISIVGYRKKDLV